MSKHWQQVLDAAVKSTGSLLCAGLDPDIKKIPEIFGRTTPPESGCLSFLSAYIDLSISMVCAYKLQKAFFDSFANGYLLLRDTIARIRSHGPDRLIILDCKIGDTQNTMRAYLSNLFTLPVDVIVINPYMGRDVFDAFRHYPDKGGAVLVRTSNAGADIIQDKKTDEGVPFWMYILNLVIEEWRFGQQLFPVLSSHVGKRLDKLRVAIPDSMPVLFAGFGAQGGRLEDMSLLLNSERAGVIVSSSRALLYPYHTKEANWQKSVRAALLDANERINAFR